MKRKSNTYQSDSFQVSGKSILLIVISVAILITAVLSLNALDKHRKFVQFQELNTAIEKSEYPSRFLPLIDKFNPSDTLLIRKIIVDMGIMIDEIDLVDDAELYIRSNGQYYKIIRNAYSCYTQLADELYFLPKDISSVIEYLDIGTPDMRELFDLTNTSKNNYTIVKIGNGFLQVKDYRK